MYIDNLFLLVYTNYAVSYGYLPFTYIRQGGLRKDKANMRTLKDVKVGDTATVVKLHGEGPVRRRIMDMGITKRVEIYVRKVAPLGDPMELTVRGYELTLRKADAEMIEVE